MASRNMQRWLASNQLCRPTAAMDHCPDQMDILYLRDRCLLFQSSGQRWSVVADHGGKLNVCSEKGNICIALTAGEDKLMG